MPACCHRCGQSKNDFRDRCEFCNFSPLGESLQIAWLFSRQYLSRDELALASERIREGEIAIPDNASLRKARKALHQDLWSDRGLSIPARISLILCSIVLTPLPGLVLAYAYRRERPRIALQALALSVPFSLVYTALGIFALFQ